MNSTVTNSLSRENIRQLLAAVGSRASGVSTEIATCPYNWREPHYFSREQLTSLEDFTKNLAAAVAEKFALFYHSHFDVTIVSTTQHFAGELLGQVSGSKARDTASQEPSDYYLAFGSDQKHLCGFVSIPKPTAVAWVSQLLGEAESKLAHSGVEGKDSGEVLSQLEESLLQDIAAAIVAALSACHCDPATREPSYSSAPSTGSGQVLSGAEGFEPAKTIVRGEIPVELQQLEALCKIVFAVRKAGSENSSQAYLVIPCGELARQWHVTGKTAGRDPASRSATAGSAEDISKAIIGHLHRMPVSISAQLACTYLTFQELVAIRPGDILLLDKGIDELVELIVEGRTLLRGRPAKSVGQYAVVITESPGNKTQT